jgi:feruloyl esterase
MASPGCTIGRPSSSVDLFKYIVFKDPKWDWRTFDIQRDVPLADQIDNGTMNAVNPDLKAFKQRGGRLLIYHEWSDQNVPPLSTINYYMSVLNRMGSGPQTAEWLRLFVVPGMAHCRGGEGPNIFDTVTALEQMGRAGEGPRPDHCITQPMGKSNARAHCVHRSETCTSV